MTSKHHDQNFTFPSLHVWHSESWSPVGHRREPHSQTTYRFILWLARLTRSTQWVLASRRASASVLATPLIFGHPPNATRPSRPSLRSSSARQTLSKCLFYPHTFFPAWPGLPVRCPESQSPIGCCESPPSSGFSLLPTRRRGYPSGIIVLISCQMSTLVSRWAPMLSACKWGSSIQCRESDLPSDVVRPSLSDIPNSFYLPSQ